MGARIAAAVYGLSGAAALCWGLYLWWPPAALMFAGVFMLGDAWRLSGSLASRSARDGGDDR